MKWYNVELSGADRDALRKKLHAENILFETGQIDRNWTHFSIYCNPATAENLDNFLENL